MAKKIFINLPVADLQKAMAFYTAIGFTNNPQFTDETAACMVVTEEIYVMLLTNSKFREFTKKEIGNNNVTASVINCYKKQQRFFPQSFESITRKGFSCFFRSTCLFHLASTLWIFVYHSTNGI
ncbi:hypothetical protein [Agriterribacter sp.]|uniref:VOC family protein n=1 Tax=Agriterribacter sp. TaxID=2821509 RepID=UPI002CE78898|nr:hypothetical protein [Agriterribacter sp.]HTN06946.1 hypothetical protein [Agriterribacter sp.]